MKAKDITDPEDELRAVRRDIDTLDDQLVDLLARRLDLARRASAPKARGGMPTFDLAREATVVRRAAAAAREHGIGDEGVRQIFWRIIDLAREAQGADADADERRTSRGDTP